MNLRVPLFFRIQFTLTLGSQSIFMNTHLWLRGFYIEPLMILVSRSHFNPGFTPIGKTEWTI